MTSDELELLRYFLPVILFMVTMTILFVISAIILIKSWIDGDYWGVIK